MLIYTDLNFQTIEEIKAETIWPAEYNSVLGLVPYIKRQGEHLQGIEIGTERGESAYLILEQCSNVDKLYTLDPYLEWENWNGTVPRDVQVKFKVIAKKNLEKFGDRVIQLNLTSESAILTDGFKSDSMDFIYIDGNCSYEDTLFDLTNYYPILKKGGIFAGHNYQFRTVFDALNKFREDNKIRIPITRSSNGVYFWKKV